MPIINRQDAQEVGQYIDRFFGATGTGRAQALRRLFVEKLDFASATGGVSLANAPKNVVFPPQAERIASMEGLHVVYAPLNAPGPDRVRKAEAAAAAKLIADTLHGDLLLVMTNPSCSQLHVIYPTFVGAATSLRRMIIERDLPRRTAVQQLSEIYHDWKKTSSIRHAVDTAFDVEAVTKQFFEAYKRVFDSVMAAVKGFGQSEEEAETKKLFVQTLFNRLMFIYFLSRKGWLKFNGDPDYLNALWRANQADKGGGTFYVKRLMPLFFAALNNPQSFDFRKNNPTLYSLIGDVPFLNGGLFDQTDEDKRANILVPDAAINEILNGLFDRFNFTVMESTPFDVEVAIDPEMLGKVFEGLVTGRHESGSYYTPRPVVSFMCREALKGYLETQDTGASTDAIGAFVDHKDTSKLAILTAPKIGEALARVKVVDPACGSGAYLLGMMQELVELMTALYSAQLSHEAQDLYNLKLRIIQQNLYGADLDQFAINIAMLRLWLSLAIDYDGPVPPPLPNLDFKIVCGDSLLGPDPSPENFGDLFRHRVHQLAGQLAALKDRHMRATGQEKTNLTKDIEGLKAQLREALAESAVPEGVVDWRVEFAEVFDQNGGFDIAMANPPYGIEVLTRHRYLAANADSYACFFILGTELARRGMLAFITPTSWETGERYAAFRRKLFERLAPRTLVNLPYDVFAAAYVDTAVTVGAVTNTKGKSLRLATLDKRTNLDLHSIESLLSEVPWTEVEHDPALRIPLLSWSARLFRQISASCLKLEDVVETKRGIEAYQYDILKTPVRDAFPYFAGTVRRYCVIPSPEKLFVSISNKDVPFHTGPRLLVRRLVSRSNRLMAAYTTQDFVCKKDLYSLRLKQDPGLEMFTLLAFLNSSLLSFLYLSRSASATKDDFRQVTLAGLRELPVRQAVSPDTQEQIRSLVQVIERAPDSDDSHRADAELDSLVFLLYGVDDRDAESVRAWLTRPG
jgi:hypothetical protein